MKSYFCVDAKCPFYKGDDGHSTVSCEGVEKAVCLKISFHLTEPLEVPWNEKDEFKKFFYKKCAGDFKKCPVFRLIITENYPGVSEGLKPFDAPVGNFVIKKRCERCPKKEVEGQLSFFKEGTNWQNITTKK